MDKRVSLGAKVHKTPFSSIQEEDNRYFDIGVARVGRLRRISHWPLFWGVLRGKGETAKRRHNHRVSLSPKEEEEERRAKRGTKPTHRLAPAVRQDTKYR
jgi:hypothetical protein